jgi:flavin reductase (DIM6/NTAB) family NADH-FMN oxidoreductase RutF
MPPDRHPVSVFRRLTNGIYVIGVAHGGKSNAFTAAWLTQVSFDPLLVALSVNPDHASYPLLTRSGVFAVSVVAHGRLDLARHFGTRSGRDVDKLRGMGWHGSPLGAPVLNEAAAWLECRVTATTPAGDHELVIGRATAGGVLDEALAPMAYAETGELDGSADLYPTEFTE